MRGEIPGGPTVGDKEVVAEEANWVEMREGADDCGGVIALRAALQEFEIVEETGVAGHHSNRGTCSAGQSVFSRSC